MLLAAALAAIVWANIDLSSYESVWRTQLSIRIGGSGISQDLREWVNNGLMTFFFFVIGLEVRREFDVGELRERRRLTLPVLAALGGMIVPIAIYLAFNAGKGSAQGWGVAMSTDTAFALGMLALVGPRFPDRLRGFMLTIIVVDDVVALLVIAVAYSGDDRARAAADRGRGLRAWSWSPSPLGIRAEPRLPAARAGLLGGAVRIGRRPRRPRPRRRPRHRGLPGRPRRAGAGDEPLPQLPRAADPGARPLGQGRAGGRRLAECAPAARSTTPGPATSIVPLFALANVGIAIDGDFLSRAYSSPITLGIVVGYILGKPVGVAGVSWLVTRLSRGKLRPPVGWAATIGGGAIAGIGFTVSLLIASLAFHGAELREAKLGVLSAALGASILTWLVFRATAMLPRRARIRALLGGSEMLVDLGVPVDPDRDHLRGPAEAPVTVVEYGDFECPYCGRAESVMRELLGDFGDVRYVWRHLPLSDVHPNAELAAEAAEAAAAQGEFWEMHDQLLDHQGELRRSTCAITPSGSASTSSASTRTSAATSTRRGSRRTSTRPTSAASPGRRPSSSTSSRHDGAYDIETLSAAVRAAGARSTIKP